MVTIQSDIIFLVLLMLRQPSLDTAVKAQPTSKAVVIGGKIRFAVPPDLSACHLSRLKATVALSVNEKGNVKNATIKESSVSACADQAALDAARQYRFSPKLEDGVPVAFTTSITIQK